MNREFFDAFISETYDVTGDHPWMKYPGNTVYRHERNKKCFAIVMTLPKSKFEGSSCSLVDVVNLKCDPILIGSLRSEKGIYPAYHMNKAHWISVLLDGTVDTDKLRWLVNISYDLTAPSIKSI